MVREGRGRVSRSRATRVVESGRYGKRVVEVVGLAEGVVRRGGSSRRF